MPAALGVLTGGISNVLTHKGGNPLASIATGGLSNVAQGMLKKPVGPNPGGFNLQGPAGNIAQMLGGQFGQKPLSGGYAPPQGPAGQTWQPQQAQVQAQPQQQAQPQPQPQPSTYTFSVTVRPTATAA